MNRSTESDFPSSRRTSRLFGRAGALIIIPNVLLLGGIVAYTMYSRYGAGEQRPVAGEQSPLKKRIAALEEALERDPLDGYRSLELARLYRDAGEFHWSYDALRAAEKRGRMDRQWRLKLGVAYLELGKNDDGVRVLSALQSECKDPDCSQSLAVRIDIFNRVAQRFKEQRIDARADHTAVDRVMKTILKPAQIDPVSLGHRPAEERRLVDPAKKAAAEKPLALPEKASAAP
jgi:hypothetical protein